METPEGEEFKESNPDAGKENDGISPIGDDELSKLAVAKALGFEKITQLNKYSDQVQRLVEYAKLNGATDITSTIARLNALRNQVGMNKDIYNLSVYAGLAIERAKIQKEMDTFIGK